MSDVAAHRRPTLQDPVALAEIDLTGELMIAAAAASEERLSTDRIDELLRVEAARDARPDAAGGEPAAPGA
ncbi:hypothetical protein ADL22_29025 [Streptomyces sp. NRRL F-4489]|uniref:hypothetical protein n=1 Tax=Streptomyces sp. NRRL F-4489 TaxID=1609095 RepID=UPI00074918D5|nr:hypothetical protein [Streptomyces sp. NRRL F-4489]KUL34943.1 hypothetical protein ADL22_29025 [Streptomyces sp. NRRL F-4489]